jgi:aminopeptidase N
VWAPKDNLEHTRFSLVVAENVLSYYEKFFKIPYPLPKIGKKIYKRPAFAKPWGGFCWYFRRNSFLHVIEDQSFI